MLCSRHYITTPTHTQPQLLQWANCALASRAWPEVQPTTQLGSVQLVITELFGDKPSGWRAAVKLTAALPGLPPAREILLKAKMAVLFVADVGSKRC